MEKKEFESIDLKHKFNIDYLEGELCLFSIEKCDFSNIKSFIFLLKELVEFLQEKKIKYINQIVNTEDKVYFKKSNIIEIGNDCHKIITPIEHFMTEMVSVLDIKIL